MAQEKKEVAPRKDVLCTLVYIVKNRGGHNHTYLSLDGGGRCMAGMVKHCGKQPRRGNNLCYCLNCVWLAAAPEDFLTMFTIVL